MTLISDHHKALYQQYYAEQDIKPTPSRWQDKVEAIAYRTGSSSILDYGCGAVNRFELFIPEFQITSYDPGVPEFDIAPQPADLVICLDVLEHVEPEKWDAVLKHLNSLAVKALFVVVSYQESKSKVLPDGTPWHSFVQSEKWWRNTLHDFEEIPRHDNRQEFVALKIKKEP